MAIEAVTAATTLRLTGTHDAPVIRPPHARAGRRAALAAAVATLTTHAGAWHGVIMLEPALGYVTAVAAVEAIVVLAEAVAYRCIVPLPWPDALLVSLIVNAASTTVGLALYAVGFA
jgi:hypothetical protein